MSHGIVAKLLATSLTFVDNCIDNSMALTGRKTPNKLQEVTNSAPRDQFVANVLYQARRDLQNLDDFKP